MLRRLTEFIFFGNYFIGILAIVLSIESALQLHLPLNSLVYYIILFSASVTYYTYAYTGPLNLGEALNPRTKWYHRNHHFILWSQRILFSTCTVLGFIFLKKNFTSIESLPLQYWLIIGVIFLSGLLYYGLVPNPFLKFNLRKTGWLKAFVIGFVWACCANLLSFIVLQIEQGPHAAEPVFMLWLFVKNWIFCTVNAIMFDIKDYAHDSNKQLKTFVVRYGLRKTIFYILIPLISVGLFSLIAFTVSRNFGAVPILINLLPFIVLLRIAWTMQKPHSLFYYLVIIDGLILFKGLCGIAGSYFLK